MWRKPQPLPVARPYVIESLCWGGIISHSQPCRALPLSKGPRFRFRHRIRLFHLRSTVKIRPFSPFPAGGPTAVAACWPSLWNVEKAPTVSCGTALRYRILMLGGNHFPSFPTPAGLCPFPKVPALGSGIGCGFPSPQHGENTAFFPVSRWRPNGCGSLLAIPLECGESPSHFPRSYLIESLRIPVSLGLGRNIGKRTPSALAGRPFFCRGRHCAAPPFPWGRDRIVPNSPTLFAWAGGLSAACFSRTAGR